MNESFEIIEIECPRCGNTKSYRRFLQDHTEFGECVSCGKMTYHKVLKNPYETVVKCPYCNSTNTKKISNLSKAAGIATFGVFAIGKATKQWHCNNCKSDF